MIICSSVSRHGLSFNGFQATLQLFNLYNQKWRYLKKSYPMSDQDFQKHHCLHTYECSSSLHQSSAVSCGILSWVFFCVFVLKGDLIFNFKLNFRWNRWFYRKDRCINEQDIPQKGPCECWTQICMNIIISFISNYTFQQIDS